MFAFSVFKTLFSTQTWSKQVLTYSIINSSKELSLDDTKAAFRYGFDQLSTVISKEFIEQRANSTSDREDISISFFTPGLNGIGLIVSSSWQESIYFNGNEKWKKYIIGEKVDPKQRDITWEAMNQILNLFKIDGLPNSDKISLDAKYSDSNGNYVLPKYV
uniref:Peptidase M10 metallopeptidase domain-containing protein n=1 Tax=Panagrolaimus davidi TaxID=227884 RepID=A0A914R1K8_9BILA